MSAEPKYHLAYVFERFPSFTQTFCVREVMELERLGVRPMLFSIHDTREEGVQHFPKELHDRVHVLPREKELVERVKEMKAAGAFPQSLVLTLRHWENRPDKMRVYEGAYIGKLMADAGVRHAHSHFAGVGARACWWLRHFYAHTFSFTGHANDIFCEEPEDRDVRRDRLMGDASLVVTVSDYTAGYLRDRFPGAGQRVRRVYNGLDLLPFGRAVGQAKAEPPLVLSVGRLIEKKGFDDLVTACAKLKERGFLLRCKIVGEGPLEEELAAQIAELGVEDVVELAGPQPQDAIIDLLAEATVFALPCVTEKDGGKDNLPTVIMEAMAAGLPCVSTVLAGVPEMVADGETGRLVPEREPDAFAEALGDVLSDPKAAIAMGEAGERRARELFAKEVTSKQLLGYLVADGLVNRDVRLVAEHSWLGASYRKQRWLRMKRVLCRANSPTKRPPPWIEVRE